MGFLDRLKFILVKEMTSGEKRALKNSLQKHKTVLEKRISGIDKKLAELEGKPPARRTARRRAKK